MNRSSSSRSIAGCNAPLCRSSGQSIARYRFSVRTVANSRRDSRSWSAAASRWRSLRNQLGNHRNCARKSWSHWTPCSRCPTGRSWRRWTGECRATSWLSKVSINFCCSIKSLNCFKLKPSIGLINEWIDDKSDDSICAMAWWVVFRKNLAGNSNDSSWDLEQVPWRNAIHWRANSRLRFRSLWSLQILEFKSTTPMELQTADFLRNKNFIDCDRIRKVKQWSAAWCSFGPNDLVT